LNSIASWSVIITVKKATVTYQGKSFECAVGCNLRTVLKKNDASPYNNRAALFNCKGLGTCGTCAVEVHGKVSHMTWIEQTRLNLPPLKGNYYLRLSCQTEVLGDLTVVKHAGFWGQKVDEEKGK
jgi:ferredoxin